MEKSNTELKRNLAKAGKKSKSSVRIKKFFFDHFFVGIYGFAAFFLFTIFIDFFTSLFNPDKTVNIDLFTLLIGIAGFALAFSFSFLENYKK